MAKKVKKKELGLGIRALLSNTDTQVEDNKEEVVKELSSSVAMIPIDQVNANPEQPRKEFDAEPLEELCESIKVHGLIQPITLRRMNDQSYQLISGERRLRASKMAGLTEVPAYVRIANDQEMLEMALIENIQREALNPMEIAFTYSRLLKEFELTHGVLAERVGKKRSTVTNFINLLDLPPSIQTALKNKQISTGHAKALNGVKDIGLQLALLKKIINEQLSVRATENLIKAQKEAGNTLKKPTKTNLPTEYQHIQDNLSHHYGSKVVLKLDPNKKEKGQITINFSDTEELNRLLDMMNP